MEPIFALVLNSATPFSKKAIDIPAQKATAERADKRLRKEADDEELGNDEGAPSATAALIQSSLASNSLGASTWLTQAIACCFSLKDG